MKNRILIFNICLMLLMGCSGGGGSPAPGCDQANCDNNNNDNTSEAQACGEQTGTAVAIDFDYVVARNASRVTMLSATSTDISYVQHTYQDEPLNWSRRYKAYRFGNGGGAITSWILGSEPQQGRLYESGQLRQIGERINDPDELVYVPNINYEGNDQFTYCVTDSTGRSNTATVSIEVADPDNYPMPIGVPNPGFGIADQPPADPNGWPSEEVPQFYYINGEHPNCSDGLTYGYPEIPRCTLANGMVVQAGYKAVIANQASLRDFSWHLIDLQGAPNNPAWLVGDDRAAIKPTITPPAQRSDAQLRLLGGHFRISGLRFERIVLRHMGAQASMTTVDGAVIRHSEVRDHPAIGRGGTTVGFSGGGEGSLAFNVYAHDNGVVHPSLLIERDIHAFVGFNQNGFWILDSSCNENAGDCVQLTNNNTTRNVYVGRLASHSEGENCIDIKDFNQVVVSESDCWDLRRVQYGNSGGNAQSFYVNDEGVQSGYAFFLNNRSWDTNGVHFGASNIGGTVAIMGNVGFFGPADGINFGTGGAARYALLNTIQGADNGMYLFNAGSATERYAIGNVIIDAQIYQTRLQGDNVVLDYNMYTSSNGQYARGGSSPSVVTGLENFRLNTREANSVDGVVTHFRSPQTYHFELNNQSALIDVIPNSVITSLSPVTYLLNDLNVTLTDREGTVRPDITDFDAGADAFE